MLYQYLKTLLLGEFGITIIIYIGAVLINGLFKASDWNTCYNYNEVLNAWRIVIFAIITLMNLIAIFAGAYK